MLHIDIPAGKLASETDNDAIAKAKREALRQKLLSGGRIVIAPQGNNDNNTSNDTNITIPAGKLANTQNDDAIAKAKRAALREKLLRGDRIGISPTGSVTDQRGENNNSNIQIPAGKLAAPQWYEVNPDLLEAEKMVMRQKFPDFTLEEVGDGRLAWVGKLNLGIYESKTHRPLEYNIMAIYMSNHPHQQMGSSVRVYPLLPDVDELINLCGFRPYHLLTDSDGERYLCTNAAEDQKVGQVVTTAASVIAWACKWFMAYELVLTGDLSRDLFNQHGGI